MTNNAAALERTWTTFVLDREAKKLADPYRRVNSTNRRERDLPCPSGHTQRWASTERHPKCLECVLDQLKMRALKKRYTELTGKKLPDAPTILAETADAPVNATTGKKLNPNSAYWYGNEAPAKSPEVAKKLQEVYDGFIVTGIYKFGNATVSKGLGE